MPLISPETIYTKTAKGILELKNKSVKLPRELGLIFLSVDGKASVEDLQPRSGMTPAQLQHALSALVTDGYIKVVGHGGPQVAAEDNVDFSQKQVFATVNAEAASHALAAADAAKRAQAEAKAALEARLRQEAEARARALAESRAAAESEAKAKAAEAARAAAEERAKAEREAAATADPATRTDAEARARAAAAAVVRAEAEVRVRAEAEDRARTQADEKRGSEEEAAREAEARGKAEAQAHARAAAEGRAKDLLEAQLKAMEDVRAAGDPNSAEAEAARARLRQIEGEAERAREAARENAEAEGRANEVPQPEMDISERVRQLHARVAAQRHEHEAARPDPLAVEFESDQPRPPGGETYSGLKLDTVASVDTPQPLDDLPIVEIPTDEAPGRAAPPGPGRAHDAPEPGALPVIETGALPVFDFDLDRLERAPATEEHVPTALERAMTEMAARQQAHKEQQEAPQQEKPEEDPAARTQPIVIELPLKSESAENVEPTIDDEEPIVEKLSIDRGAHDIMAETLEAQRRKEAAQLTGAALEMRRRRAEEEARRSAAAEVERKRRRLVRNAVIAAVAIPVLGVTWLQFTTLNGYIPAAQRALSQSLNQPVQIQNLRYVLFPTPRLKLEDVWIGSGRGVKVKALEARMGPLAALTGPSSFDLVEARGVEIDPEILGTIPKWTGGRPADTMRVGSLRFADLKVNMPGQALGPFNGNVAFASNGTVKDAAFENDKVRATLTPTAEGVRVALDATSWKIPYGPPLTFDRLKLSGLVDQKQVAAGEFTGTLAAGTIDGAVTARWAGPVSVQGEFKLQNARLLDLTQELSPNFGARGTVKANGRFSMQGADWTSLRANPQVESSFSVTRGELTNVDLVRAIQSAAPGAIRGGRTAFEDLSGVMEVSGDRVAFRQIQLTSGALNANGTVDVGTNGQLSGRFNAQLAAGGGGVVARSSLGVTGTVENPGLTR